METIILAIIQGITEFLPISSSGHLVIATHLFGMSDTESNLILIVFLHFMSLLAILISFYAEIIDLLTKPKIILMIIIGTIPAGLIGYLFNEQINQLFDGTTFVGIAMVLTGLYILLTEMHWKNAPISLENASLKSALWVGIAQAAAIVPGLSRSGMTICTGLLNGWDRRDSIKFAFFLAVPVILGASILKIKDFSKLTASFEPIIILSGVICLFVSLLSLHFLVRIIRRGKLFYFGWYCLIVGIATIIFI